MENKLLLHQLLAFEQDEVNRSKKVLEEAKDTFGTKQSGADWDINDIYDLVNIIDRVNQ
jgi:hypothetical protein